MLYRRIALSFLFIYLYIGVTPTYSQNEDSSFERYIVSSLYDKGQVEVALFSNYYNHKDALNGATKVNSRHIFFTNFFSVLYGINKRINVGIEGKLRSVSQRVNGTGSLFEAFSFSNDGDLFDEDDNFIGYDRTGFTGIGPKVKYQPFRSLGNLTIQHTLHFAIGSELEGNDETGFIDWDAPTFLTQFFYDQPINEKLAFFLEVDFMIENLGKHFWSNSTGYYNTSIPLTFIVNYFPENRSNLYLLMSSSPRWGTSIFVNLDEVNRQVRYIPFSQFGIGYKYQLTPGVQLEVLYTRFTDTVPNRKADTYNFGVRIFQ